MSCFVALTLAHLQGTPGPAREVLLAREQIVFVRAAEPVDPQRPSARSILRIGGSGTIYVMEPPDSVIRAPCRPQAPGG